MIWGEGRGRLVDGRDKVTGKLRSNECFATIIQLHNDHLGIVWFTSLVNI